jgi:hypothetical protein
LENIALTDDLLALPIEIDKDVGFALDDRRLDRFVNKVHCAGLIASKATTIIWAARSEEDDGNVARTQRSSHQFGQFKAVHDGHLNIEDGKRNFMLQKQLKRLGARSCLKDREAFAPEQPLQRKQILLHVINEENFYGLIGGSLCAAF